MPLSDEEKKARRRAQNLAYRAANREKIAAYRAEYARENADKIRSRRNRERDKARYLENRELVLARSKERYHTTVKARRAADPEYFSLRARAAKYLLTAQELRDLFESQGSCCAVCREALQIIGSRTHIDHDHDTGEVRGFLCGPCNRAIGMMQDSPSRLRAAAAYLDARQPKLRLA